MRAGLLEHRIKIYKPVTTINDFGEEETSYELYKSTRARVINTSGNRLLENHEIFYDYSKTFEVYHYINIEDFDRIYWLNKFFRVLDITPYRSENKKVIRAELINE